jgi:hypothetical protein
MSEAAHHTDRETRKPRERATARRHRSPHGPGLWVTDKEIIEQMGVPEDIASTAIRMLDRDRGSGFPPKQELYGNRRYWPAVKAYFDRLYGPKMETPRRERP